MELDPILAVEDSGLPMMMPVADKNNNNNPIEGKTAPSSSLMPRDEDPVTSLLGSGSASSAATTCVRVMAVSDCRHRSMALTRPSSCAGKEHSPGAANTRQIIRDQATSKRHHSRTVTPSRLVSPRPLSFSHSHTINIHRRFSINNCPNMMSHILFSQHII